MSALILMYHRVAETPSDPWGLCVTPEHFAEQLDVLRTASVPTTLQQLADALDAGAPRDRSVVVTFDDGYADNLHTAKPLLQHQNIPATFCITTGYLGSGRGFWWDELEQLLFRSGRLPPTLSLRLDGTTREWALEQDAEYSEAERHRHRHWRTSEPAPTRRHALYLSLWRLLQPMPESQRREVFAQLTAWAGEPPATRLLLSPEEVTELAEGDLVEIGSHTVTHPVLSALPVEQQRDEVFRSKSALEGLVGIEVRSFSYPYGMRSEVTAALVREAGYATACSTVERPVTQESDRLSLPRVQVQNWSGEDFRARLSRWLAG
jgi:peptidoglycan/xylan/chitin deacetylase (PgdA/CDA1 family)